MEISSEQYESIAHCLPKQRGNVSHDNLLVLNAILYILEYECKWRDLPEHFGNWHTIYTRTMRWQRSGILENLFLYMQKKDIIQVTVEKTIASCRPRKFLWSPKISVLKPND